MKFAVCEGFKSGRSLTFLYVLYHRALKTKHHTRNDNAANLYKNKQNSSKKKKTLQSANISVHENFHGGIQGPEYTKL